MKPYLAKVAFGLAGVLLGWTSALHWMFGVNLIQKYDSKQFKALYKPRMPHIFPSNASSGLATLDQEKLAVLQEPLWASRWAQQEIFATFFVLSAPSNRLQRQKIRQRFRNLSGCFSEAGHHTFFTLTFLLGTTSNATLEGELSRESGIHGDFLRVNVEDSYRNLRFKTLAAFRWVAEKGRRSETGSLIRWIVKMDDDLEVPVEQLLLDLKQKDGSDEAILCSAKLQNPLPFRNSEGYSKKWYVSDQQWPENVFYPDICLGWLYVLTPKVADKLVQASKTAPFVFIDDVYITGLLREEAQDVKLRQMDSTEGWRMFSCTFMSHMRSKLLLNYAYPSDHVWPWAIVKDLLCDFADLINLRSLT